MERKNAGDIELFFVDMADYAKCRRNSHSSRSRGAKKSFKQESTYHKGRKYWTLQLSLFWPSRTDHANRARNTYSSSNNSAYILCCSKRVEHTPLK